MTDQFPKLAGSDVAGSIQLSLPFLGNRSYLHGTTLFDALSRHVPKKARRVFKFSRLITTNRVMVAALERIDARGDPVSATLAYQTDSDTGCLGVMPLEPGKDLIRIPYDEGLVTNVARFSSRRVELDLPSPFSFVATIVPLNKALLLREVPQEGRGQWLFTRLDVDEVPERAGPIVLVVRDSLGGRIVRSEVEVGGSRVGELYFSWWVRT